MTHVRNVEGFGKLVDFCSGYGGRYNPGSPNLHIDQLNALLAQAKQALQTTQAAKAGYDHESNQRAIVFDNIRKLASGVVLTLTASGANAQTIKDARAYVLQMNGKRTKDQPQVTADTAAQAPAPKSRSVAHMDFASMVDHLAGLALIASGEPKYQPNEQEFTVNSLNAKVNELQSLNQNATMARRQWSNARIDRNSVLYTNPNALHSTAMAVKKYIKAVFGSGSEQYRQVAGLHFTKPKL